MPGSTCWEGYRSKQCVWLLTAPRLAVLLVSDRESPSETFRLALWLAFRQRAATKIGDGDVIMVLNAKTLSDAPRFHGLFSDSLFREEGNIVGINPQQLSTRRCFLDKLCVPVEYHPHTRYEGEKHYCGEQAIPVSTPPPRMQKLVEARFPRSGELPPGTRKYTYKIQDRLSKE